MTVSYDFTGRTAVVTGASKGIGRRIAERLRDAGAQVWNFDLYPIELHGIRQLWVDVTDAGQIADAVAQLQEKTSRLDILVNNAGFTGGSLTVEQLDPADWRRIIEVNLTGVFEVTRHVVPVMRQGGWGRIVNIASLAGKDGSPNLSAYSWRLQTARHRATPETKLDGGVGIFEQEQVAVANEISMQAAMLAGHPFSEVAILRDKLHHPFAWHSRPLHRVALQIRENGSQQSAH